MSEKYIVNVENQSSKDGTTISQLDKTGEHYREIARGRYVDLLDVVRQLNDRKAS